MKCTIRPLSEAIKVKLRKVDQRHSQFKSSYQSTLVLLQTEISNLHADEYVMQIDVDERHIRLDGGLYANARPYTSWLAINFTGYDGPMEFVCGQFWDWQDNVRGIAKGLEALRMIERYGISTGTEQYAGFRALGSGIAMGPAQMTADEAAAYIARAAWPNENDEYQARWVHRVIEESDFRDQQYRIAAKKLHPDVGGSVEDFQRLDEARRILEAS